MILHRVVLASAFLLAPILTAPLRAQATGAVTGTSLNVTTVSTGTVLRVNPAASADRRYVGMGVDTQFSTLGGVDTFVLGSASGTVGGVVGNGRAPQAVALNRAPFRPAVVGRVIFVDNDKPLLAAAIKPMTLNGVSIKQAARQISDATKENLVLGVRGLEQAKVDLNAPHDFKIGKVADAKDPLTVKDALLAIVQAAMPETDLVITTEDKVITLVSQKEADQTLVTRTYYLEDLLAAMPRFVAGGTDLGEADAARKPVAQVEPSATTQAQGKSLSPVKAAKAKPAPAANSTNILEVITSTVRPEIWKNHGGKADIHLVNNVVTVKAPASVQVLFEGPKVHNPNKVNSYVTYGQ